MLILDRRSSWKERLYIAYGRRLVRRAFARVRVTESPHGTLPGHPVGTSWAAGDAPLIAYINHSAWWDAVVPLVLSRDLFLRESYALMEGEQLRRYPFFRSLGCFGPTSSSPSDARATLAHAVSVLRGGPRRTLWICPQGALLPAQTPLSFKSGLARLARAVPEARLVPIALRFEFGDEPLPTCHVRIGAPVQRLDDESIKQTTLRLTEALVAELEQLDEDLKTERPRT